MGLIKINGTISFYIKTGGGFDTNGDPIPVSDKLSDPTPCLISTNKNINKGHYKDGEFTAVTYEIFILSQEFNPGKVKLTDDRGNDLGEYMVQQPDIQFLDLVGQVKITV